MVGSIFDARTRAYAIAGSVSQFHIPNHGLVTVFALSRTSLDKKSIYSEQYVVTRSRTNGKMLEHMKKSKKNSILLGGKKNKKLNKKFYTILYQIYFNTRIIAFA